MGRVGYTDGQHGPWTPGVILDTRVHGPWTRLVFTDGTRVVFTELKSANLENINEFIGIYSERASRIYVLLAHLLFRWSAGIDYDKTENIPP